RRLACVYALLDLSVVVRRPHLRAALTLWGYAEASVKYVFGDSTGNPKADEILRLLRSAKSGLKQTEISDLVGRNLSSDQLSRALGLLLEFKLARFVEEKTAGRPARRWFATGGLTS